MIVVCNLDVFVGNVSVGAYVFFFETQDDIVGTYLTKPGTALGEPERVNVVNPVTSTIAISCENLTAAGGTVSISEVSMFLFRTPKSKLPSCWCNGW